MVDPGTGEAFTAHTTGPVQFILVDDSRKSAKLREDGILADIAPTMLEMMGDRAAEGDDGDVARQEVG